MLAYACAWMHAYAWMHTCVRVCVCARMHAWMYEYLVIFACVCMRTYICVCMHACVYVHFATPPPPQVLSFVSPSNIEKLPTPMITLLGLV